MSKFKMAYVILCHKNAKQVNILINRLNHENVEFFLHIDKNSKIKEEIVHFRNVHFVDDPVSVQWGHYSQIESILKSFETVRKHGKYNYVHILSGQDMPLVSTESILNYFNFNEGKEFVEYEEVSKKQTRLYERVSVYYPKFLINRSQTKRVLRILYAKFIMTTKIFKRKLDAIPNTIYKGTCWLSITGDCAEYILDFTHQNPDYKNFFKYTFATDEIYFQTIILNSHFKEKVVNVRMRYADWKTGPDHPRTLTIDDLERLRNRKDTTLWARKFDIDVDGEIVGQIFRDTDEYYKDAQSQVAASVDKEQTAQ